MKKKFVDETSFCPCDECYKRKCCLEECKSFKQYVIEQNSVKREKLFNDFITLQKLSHNILRLIVINE